ncbi:unnamed protein product [Euphydryas editha]|uniref:Uncharacterized protein n=1 Tax=Euphydryas editha TaxID=104508 RepID=A0AAU9THU9_EUPED|nr:unnamed protein product [Euphydryas editha]
MDSNSVSPMPELAPIAEFDKSPPSPPNEEVPMDDLPPPPATISQAEGKKLKVYEKGICVLYHATDTLKFEVGRISCSDRAEISESGDTIAEGNMLM